MRIKAPSWGGEGMSPSSLGVESGKAFPKNVSIFYVKRRVLVDSGVLNVPVTRRRA